MPRNSTQQSTRFSQQSERNEFNYSDMSFIVYETTSSGRHNTATFSSKSKAFDFVERFCDKSSNVYIYKTKCIKAFSPSSSTSVSSTQNISMLIDAAESVERQSSSTPQVLLFDSLEYTEYGKGYMLYPSRFTTFYGEKYLLDGWWNDTQKGWFFRSQHVHQLEDNGATFVMKRNTVSTHSAKHPETSASSSSTHSSKSSIDLTGLTFSEYGKGYLLYPRSNTSFYGEKYLLDGWWNSSLKGWFFKREFYSQLVSHGAIYDTTTTVIVDDNSNTIDDNSNSDTQTLSSVVGPSPFSKERDLSRFTIHTYGRGYVVRCSKSNKLFKNKTPYLLGNLGFWNTNAGGWFFQKQYFASVKALGAVFVKSEQSSDKYTSIASSSTKSSTRCSTRSSRSTRSNTPSVDYVCSDSQFY